LAQIKHEKDMNGKEFLEDFDPQIKEVGSENYSYTTEQVIQRLDAFKKKLFQNKSVDSDNPHSNIKRSFISDEIYWKIRCQLSEAIEASNPCDPDITEYQIKAYEDYNKFISRYGNKKISNYGSRNKN
jgi:hypothetical protein